MRYAGYRNLNNLGPATLTMKEGSEDQFLEGSCACRDTTVCAPSYV